MKKIVLNIILILVLIFSLTGCSNNSENTANTNVTTTSSQNQVKNEANNQTSSQTVEDPFKDFDFKTAAEKQMALPEEGETIAILKVKDYGDIKVKFFEEVAPKAVENFITHAKNGYYNGVTFHRVIQDFMIQGGDPEGTGRGGESIWGKGFPEEFDIGLVPYRGSLCMASAGVGTSSLGSQFFITQAKYSETMSTYLRQGGYPEGLLEQYKEYDGYMSLYLQYTVFGQVFEGMDVVDKIAMIETETTKEGQEDKPVKDVIIEKIEVTTYKAK